MSDRRLLTLVKQLPPSSRTWGGWSRTDQLLATLVDTMRILDWHLVQANVESPSTVDPPELIGQPWLGDEDADSTPRGQSQRPEQGLVVDDPTLLGSAVSDFLAFVPPGDEPKMVNVVTPEDWQAER